MKIRNVLTALGAAAVTAALTLALLAPWGDAQAGPAVRPFIAQPRLTSQGCTFALKTDKEAYEAGEAPGVEVAASNPTDKPVDASVWVSVTTRAPTNPMSRMLPMPLALWSHEYAFTLAPGETKSLKAACAGLPAGKNVSILLTDQKDAILAASLGIPAGGPNGGPNAGQMNAVASQTPQP
jgi:hypothetical protein